MNRLRTARRIFSAQPMRGEHPIDPESGAPLSEEREYPFDGSHYRGADGDVHFHDPPAAVSTRTPMRDKYCAWSPDREGALTTGADTSSHKALTVHFKRECDINGEFDPEAVRAAAHEFKKLRSTLPRLIDELAWYAVAQRLDSKGFAVEWMRNGVSPLCPHCGSTCKPSVSGPRCASDENGHGHVADAIEEAVLDAYRTTWSDTCDFKRTDRVTAFE